MKPAWMTCKTEGCRSQDGLGETGPLVRFPGEVTDTGALSLISPHTRQKLSISMSHPVKWMTRESSLEFRLLGVPPDSPLEGCVTFALG